MRWSGNVISPFDKDSKVYKCKDNRYRCKNTGKYFNIKTGTLFDNSKISLQKWFLAMWLISSHKKGISSLQLSRDIEVTQKTAWFMLQRIRNCFGINNILTNEVEIDETYIGGKNKNRHEHKKFKPMGPHASDKTPIIGMLQRGGKVVARKIDNVKSRTLSNAVAENVELGATVYTDELRGYSGLKNVYDHSFVRHSSGQYVNGRIHTNSIEGFWSLLKRGLFGIYHFTSKKHIQKYVDEFVFRYNTKEMGEGNRFNLLLSNTTKRLTYKDLING